MKKIAVIFILLVYSATTLGATVHLHYCMNEFVGWSVTHSKEEDKCGKCGMTGEKSGCCKDEHKHIKLSTDHQKSAFLKYDLPVAVDFQLTFLPDTKFVLIDKKITAPYNPLYVPRERLYILFNVFLI